MNALSERVLSICLFFLLAGIPLIINPAAYDFYYTPKIQSVYALIALVLGTIGIRHFVSRWPLCLPRFPLTVPLLLYAGSVIISTIFSIAPALSMRGDPWRLESMFTLLSYAVLTCIFAGLIESHRQFHQLMRALLLSAALVALYGLIQYAGINPTEHFDPLLRHNRINSTIGNTNFLGKFLVLVLPLFWAYYLTARKTAEKMLLGAGMLFTVCTLFLTFTRASWLGVCVAGVLFTVFAGSSFLLQKKKEILILVIILLGLGVGIVLYGALNKENPQGQRIFTVKDRLLSSLDMQQGRGVATRLFVWKKVIGIIQKRPLLGFGPDTHVIPMRSFNREYIQRFKDVVILDRAHNNYLDIMIGQGLVGLSAYLAIISTLLMWLGRRIKQEKDRPTKILWCGFFASFCGYLVNDFFIFSVVSVSPTFWALMGVPFALQQAEKGQHEAS